MKCFAILLLFFSVNCRTIRDRPSADPLYTAAENILSIQYSDRDAVAYLDHLQRQIDETKKRNHSASENSLLLMYQTAVSDLRYALNQAPLNKIQAAASWNIAIEHLRDIQQRHLHLKTTPYYDPPNPATIPKGARIR